MFTNAIPFINDAWIAVEGATVEQIRAWITGVLPRGASVEGGAFGFIYNVLDVSDEYRQWEKSSKELGIEEGNPFLREFDIRPYAVNFILEPMPDYGLRAAFPYVAVWTARELAAKSRRRTLIVFNGGDVPFRLYQGNRVLEDYARFYEPIVGSWVEPGSERVKKSGR